VTKRLGGRTLFDGLNLILRPGMRIGLVGANGSGKTTLLRVLNGEVAADSGSVERADLLRVVYFDQNREQLDPAITLRKALASDGDSVMYRDQPVHVAGWAKRFLFRAEQLETAVGRLSGGEQARVLIARLIVQPADLLLLDEPTNDLDIPTLVVLEESLLDFPGALVLVTHDRFLLDRVSTSVMGLNGEGGAELFAEYSQWEQAQTARKKPKPAVKAVGSQAAAPPSKRLSYLDSREWESMEERILRAEEALEQAKAAVQEAASDAARLPDCYAQMLEAQEQVDRLYARWAELEAKLQGA
jgi:ATP-binding cassette subfamily F protein uup